MRHLPGEGVARRGGLPRPIAGRPRELRSDRTPPPARGRTVFPLLVALVLLLSVTRPARCEVTVTLSLDRSDATLADSVRLSVGVSGAHGNEVNPTIQGLDDFFIRPAGTSTRVEIINGDYTAGMDFIYLLQPKKAGAFRIGPAAVTLDGKTYQSAVARLVVGNPARSPDGDRGPIFLVADLAPAKVYVEQQALYTLKLHRLVNIGDASVSMPEADGVAFTKLGDPREYQGVYQGRSYQIIELRYLVQPQKAGTLTLTPARIDLTVYQPQQQQLRGIFNNRFLGQYSSGRPLTLTSEALGLQVRPLPQEGRPADYSGLVGSFALEATVEPQSLQAGESATLTATVHGRGNVKRIPELKMPALDGVKIYADQPVQKDETTAEGVTGFKTMKWALVPEREGRYRLPSLALSYFDTTAGRYRILQTAAATLTVSPGRGNPPLSAPSGTTVAKSEAATKKAVTELGHDILPVQAWPGTSTGDRTALPQGLVSWVLLGGPPAIFFLALGGASYRRRSRGLTTAWRMRRAPAGFLRACRKKALTADELTLALQEYLNQRLGLSRGSLTADEAAEILLSRKVDADTAGTLREVWRGLEDAIYTGRGRAASSAGEQLAGLVARIEKDLR